MTAAVVRISDRLADPVPPLPLKLHATPDSDVSHKTKMTEKSQGPSITITVAIALLTLIIGVVSGLLASVAANSEWKGKMEQRMDNFEKQRTEDKATWDYIRTQNEVNGKALTRIETAIDADKRRR